MDFTGDGIVDILSGCYWSVDLDCPDSNPQAGYFYLLAGKGDGDFEQAVPLRNADAKPLTNVPLSQEKLQRYSIKGIEWANICTSQHAADYDGDGDLDLITGSMHSSIYIHVNSANSPTDAPKFADGPKKLSVRISGGHSDPHLFDWDGDGDLDLISGSSSGIAWLSTNQGSAKDPQWSEFVQLIQVTAKHEQSTDNGGEITPGGNSRIWVTDFNRDGKLDLLVGDSITIENEIPGLSDEEAARLQADYEAESKPLNDAMSAVFEKYDDAMDDNAGDKEALVELRKKLDEELDPIKAQMKELRKKEKSFRDRTSTGHVWVYLQK